jgi:hypothetical protein
MNDLVRLNGTGNGGLLPSRIERQTGRALEVVRARQLVASAQEVARVQVIADTSQAALLAASQISLIEEALSARSPQAAERLRHIADAGALGLTDVVLNAGRRCQ